MPLIALLIFVLCGAVSGAEELTLTLRTEPPIEEIQPNVDAAKIIVRVADTNGAPKSALLHVELTAPPKNSFFSTGFPMFEGTTLLNADLPASDGVLNLAVLFPIRGDYKLRVTAQPLNGGAGTGAVEWPLEIREEPAVVRNFALLVGGLILFGLIAGFIIGRSENSSPVRIANVPAAAPALLLLAFLVMGHASAHDHDEDDEEEATDHVSIKTADGEALEMRIDPVTATVGQLSTLSASISPPRPSEFTLSFVNLDHHKEIFRSVVTSSDGKLLLRHQFSDGAQHRITLSAKGAGAKTEPAVAAMTINVHAIHPPLSIRLRTLAFFLAITALAMGLGYALARRLERPAAQLAESPA